MANESVIRFQSATNGGVIALGLRFRRIGASERVCVCASISDCAWERRQPSVSVAPPFLPRTILRRMFGAVPYGSHNGCNGGRDRRVARRCTDDCSKIFQDTTVPNGLVCSQTSGKRATARGPFPEI